jgi:hypothetical protein
MFKCCCGNVEGEPCGWPSGTVRAVVTLITVPITFAIACAAIIILIINGQYDIALGINNGIWAVVGTIIGYYFGSKQGETAVKLLSESNIQRKILYSKVNRLKRQIRKVDRNGLHKTSDVVITMDDNNHI